MVRESLFNILQFRIKGANFLDLFSGTGAMGIEALSRGAKSVTFNDRARDSVNIIKSNLSKLGITEGARVCNQDALSILKSGEKFDIIYIDPPYKTELGVKALELVSLALNDGGVAIFEDEKEFSGEIEGLKITDRRKYGRVRLTFFEKGE
jgi:16S rRNA (guanine966-N2)-methyltransferase